MPAFTKKFQKDGTYHAPKNGDRWGLTPYSNEQIAEWAADPSCIEKEKCATELTRRERVLEEKEVSDERERLAEEKRLSDRRAKLEAKPFDSRTEISADARHIASRVVTALWTIFVLLPIVLAILFAILK